MKRIFCILVICVLVFSFSACGTTDTISSEESVEVSSVVSVEISSAPISSKEESIADNSSREESSSDTSSNTVARGKISITLENWKDYFEYVALPVFEKNAFDEVEKLSFAHLFKLKDEFNTKIDSDKTKIAIEYSYSYDMRRCKVDLENMTYVLGDFVQEGFVSGTATNTDSSLLYCGVHGIDAWGFEVGLYFYISGVEKDGTFLSYYNFELERIQGTLYLK